jgi:hypothetical protein
MLRALLATLPPGPLAPEIIELIGVACWCAGDENDVERARYRALFEAVATAAGIKNYEVLWWRCGALTSRPRLEILRAIISDVHAHGWRRAPAGCMRSSRRSARHPSPLAAR